MALFSLWPSNLGNVGWVCGTQQAQMPPILSEGFALGRKKKSTKVCVQAFVGLEQTGLRT
jgi:hypothetical protein